ncbi:MAG: sulfatase [Planctomycetes bacterium]|nr:sulfatase [Planctomycetota bacterium]
MSNRSPLVTNEADGAPAPLRFVIPAAAFIGLLGGAACGAYEVAFLATREKPVFALVGTLLYAALGVMLAVPFGIVVWALARLVWPALTRRQWSAVLAGVVLQGVLLICLRRALVAATLPLPWLLAGWIVRARLPWSSVRLYARCLAAASVLVVSAGALSWTRTGGGAAIVSAAWCIAALVVLGVAFRMSRRGGAAVLAVAAVVLVAGAAGSLWAWNHPVSTAPAAARAPRTGPPNVVLVVLDTFRRDRLGCYGHKGGLTPALDRLAAEGTLYEDAIAPAPWTVPSHASMFTGYFAKTHGCSPEDHLWLDDEFVTLAEMLKGDGYQTCCVLANGTVMVANLLQGFDHRVHLNHHASHRHMSITDALKEAGLPARWIDKGSIDAGVEIEEWLRRRQPADQPFFLFVNVMEPHQPYQPPLRHRRAHLPPDCGYIEASRFGARYFDGTEWHARAVAPGRRANIARALYDGLVAYQDEQIEVLLRVLRAQVDLDNTLLIVTADHGENLGEGNRWGHLFAVNDALVRVPLLVRYPPLFPAGGRVTGLCQLTDLVPTVFDVLGRPCPVEGLPGRTLVPTHFVPADAALAEWSPQHWSLRTVAEALGAKGFTEEFNARYRMIRTDDYKFIWSSDGRHGLYDVQTDPEEVFNLLTEKPEIAKELNDRLAAWFQAQPDYVPAVRMPGEPLDAQTLEILRTLGYVGQ